MTVAPVPAATSLVRPSDPLSTTMTSDTNGDASISPATRPTVLSSLSAGMTTDTFRAGTDNPQLSQITTHGVTPEGKSLPLALNTSKVAASTSVDTPPVLPASGDRKSTRLNSSHVSESR